VKQYALVKDMVNGSSYYGVVIRENGLTECKGVSGVGEKWAESYNNAETKSLDDGLPYGVKIGEFHALTQSEEILVEHMLDGNTVRFPDRTQLKQLSFHKTDANSSLPAVSNTPLSAFLMDDLQTAVDYKIRAFLSDSARASVMLKSRLERYGISDTTVGFKSASNNSFLNEDMSSVARGHGNLRRALLDIRDAKSTFLENHPGYQVGIEEKAIGRSLGRGARIGRRAARAFKPYDPNAIDGDMDGIVQEGTPWERPAVRVGGRGVRLTPTQQRARSEIAPDVGMRSRTGDGESIQDRLTAARNSRQQKLADRMREMGFDDDNQKEINDWLRTFNPEDFEYTDIDDLEIEGLTSRRGSSSPTGSIFGQRRYSSEDWIEGQLDEGPLAGSFFELRTARDYTESNFNDPGETLGGNDELTVYTPDGVVLSFENETWEDSLDLINVRAPGGDGLRSRSRRGDDEDYPRIDPDLINRLRNERFVPETSRSGRARQNRIINTPNADGGPPRRAVRERSGRVVPEPPARDRSGLRSRTGDTANRNAELTGVGTTVPKAMKANRKFFQTLAANGFVWDDKPDTSGRVRIFLPDRMSDWTLDQPDSVRNQWGKFKPARENQAAGFIHVHPGKDTPQRPENMAKRFLRTIFGDTAWDDMEANAKKPGDKRGTGRIGVIPSTSTGATGLRSATSRARTRTASTERVATPTTTGRSLRSGQLRKLGKPGVARGESDGKIWEQLDDNQRDLFKQFAQAREVQLMRNLTQDARMRKFRNKMIDDGDFDEIDEDGNVVRNYNKPLARNIIPLAQREIDDLLRDEKITEETHVKWQKTLDDIKTLRNMKESDNYEALEHLHPASRAKIIKDARGEDSSIPGVRALKADGPSTFFGDQARTASGRSAGKNRKPKRKRPFADRIITPNVERLQRRAARRQRAQAIRRGGLVRGQEADVSATQNARRKLARQLRRARRRFKGERDERAIRKIFDEKKKNHPLARTKDGAPEVNDKYVDYLAFVGSNIDKRQKGELSSDVRDSVLRDLWQNGGFNQRPELISADEMQALSDAGWQVLHRGVDRLGTQAQANTDSYKEDLDRFTPGETNLRAHGVGEYWAAPGSGHWGGYGSGMLAFIDPEGKRIQRNKLKGLSDESWPAMKEIQDLIDELGDGVAQGEDPANFVDQVMERLRSNGLEGLLEKDNEIIQVARQLLDRYKGMTPNDTKRENTWNAIQYMLGQSRQAQWSGGEGYWAPILGYDYVTSNEGVFLVHNRGSVAVLDVAEPLSGGAAKTIVDGLNEG